MKTTAYAMKRALLLLAICYVIFSGCKKDPSNSKLEEFNLNFQKWRAKGITDYSIIEKRECFCTNLGDHRIVVVNNAIISIENEHDHEVMLNAGFKTIDELFKFVKSSLQRTPASAMIEYNSIYGFPKKIYFNYEAGVADDEIGFVIKDLQHVIID